MERTVGGAGRCCSDQKVKWFPTEEFGEYTLFGYPKTHTTRAHDRKELDEPRMRMSGDLKRTRDSIILLAGCWWRWRRRRWWRWWWCWWWSWLMTVTMLVAAASSADAAPALCVNYYDTMARRVVFKFSVSFRRLRRDYYV